MKKAKSTWDNLEADVIKAIASAAKCGVGVRAHPIYRHSLELPNVKTKLIMPNISFVHRLARRGDKFFVEKTQVPRKIAVVLKENKRKKPARTRPTPAQYAKIVGEKITKMSRHTTEDSAQANPVYQGKSTTRGAKCKASSIVRRDAKKKS